MLKTGVDIKLFLGAALNSELRMLLDHSDRWKQRHLQGETSLTTTHYNNKEYIGNYVTATFPSIQYLTRLESDLRVELKILSCSPLSDTIKMQLFPQVFIS